MRISTCRQLVQPEKESLRISSTRERITVIVLFVGARSCFLFQLFVFGAAVEWFFVGVHLFLSTFCLGECGHGQSGSIW
jgi:hypothetical protein